MNGSPDILTFADVIVLKFALCHRIITKNRTIINEENFAHSFALEISILQIIFWNFYKIVINAKNLGALSVSTGY